MCQAHYELIHPSISCLLSLLHNQTMYNLINRANYSNVLSTTACFQDFIAFCRCCINCHTELGTWMSSLHVSHFIMQCIKKYMCINQNFPGTKWQLPTKRGYIIRYCQICHLFHMIHFHAIQFCNLLSKPCI